MESKQLTDANVEQTLKNITKKKAEYKSQLKAFAPVTNMNLELFNCRYNLHVVSVNELRFLKSFLLGLDGSIELCGYKVTTWVEDIINKLTNLEIKTALNKLEATENKLVTMYTPDKKNELEFNSILTELDAL